MLHTFNTQLEINETFTSPDRYTGGLQLATEKMLRTSKDILTLYLKP